VAPTDANAGQPESFLYTCPPGLDVDGDHALTAVGSVLVLTHARRPCCICALAPTGALDDGMLWTGALCSAPTGRGGGTRRPSLRCYFVHRVQRVAARVD
jgi:hypothetical protein